MKKGKNDEDVAVARSLKRAIANLAIALSTKTRYCYRK